MSNPEIKNALNMIFDGDQKTSELSVNELKKYRQRKRILYLLYRHKKLSAPEISKFLGISLPTALVLLNDLVRLGYVLEKGTGLSTGGRKPLMYGLSGDSIYVIVCDMGRYQARMALFNANNEISGQIEYIKTDIDDPDLIDKLSHAAGSIVETSKVPENRIFGFGIDMPGLVNSDNGINYTIKTEEFRNVKERLQSRFHKLVYVDNDARMQAFGEYVFGAAKGKKNALVVNWSWGIGLGMILNGKLYGGTTGFAGEFSHIQLTDNGELCICGKRGCLETIASANSLLRMAENGIKKGIVSHLTKKFASQIQTLTPEEIIATARLGDEFAISLLNKIGLALGKGLSIVIQLLNPEIIVLGGPLARANRYSLTSIQQSINKHCLENISENVEIKISDIGEKSGLLGTSAMLFQKLFSDLRV